MSLCRLLTRCLSTLSCDGLTRTGIHEGTSCNPRLSVAIPVYKERPTVKQTGYKVLRREVLQEIELCEDRFGFEPEVMGKVKGSWRFYQVPISYHRRNCAEGTKITWRDGFKGIWRILCCNLFG
jgi:hypothetical protein